jgi:hypothetical protein
MSIGLNAGRGVADDKVEERRGNTLVSSLRNDFGEEFLRDWRADVKLSAVREQTDMSLIELVRQHRRGKK